MYSATYGGGGFVPSNIQANYIGDSGVANALPAYSVNVPAGQQFTVVLHEVAPTANGNGCVYTMNVRGVPVPACAAPAALTATISGRVFAGDGITGLKNARVTLTDSNNVMRSVLTNSFGLYRISEVATGQNYTVTVSSKRFRFSPAPISLTGDLTNLNFIGVE